MSLWSFGHSQAKKEEEETDFSLKVCGVVHIYGARGRILCMKRGFFFSLFTFYMLHEQRSWRNMQVLINGRREVLFQEIAQLSILVREILESRKKLATR